jgi:hypothetical protein
MTLTKLTSAVTLVAMLALGTSPAFADGRGRNGGGRGRGGVVVQGGGGQRHGGSVYRGGGPRRVIVNRPYSRGYYRPYYGSRYYSPFYSFGFGYPFYSPFYSYGYGYGGYGYGYNSGWGSPYGPYGAWGYQNGPSYADDQGGIRLQVNPKKATVLVDGYYVGIVDDFDGGTSPLKLEAGKHRIEIKHPGFETLGIDVNILRNETIRYRGELATQ